MNRLRRAALTVAAMAAVVVMVGVYSFASSRGVFHSVEDKTPGQCRSLGGAADEIASNGKAAFIASGNGLYSFSRGTLTKLGGTPKQFKAIAMSLSRAATGEEFLRAVLAQEGGRYTITLFRLKAGAVEEIGRIASDEVSDPAAIASPDPERFYLVNRSESKTAFGRFLDNTLLLPRAHLLWFDGMKFVRVAERLNTPSGLALSFDASHLFIAQDYPRSIVAMVRNGFTGGVENPAAETLPAGPLHITQSDDDSLIIAARPKAGTGEVYRIRLENGQPATYELLYANKGEEVHAAAELGGTLLVGTDKRLLACAIR